MKIDEDVLVLIERSRTDGQQLVLPWNLDKKTYQRVNKILEAAGGKWDRRAKAHLFDGAAADRVDQLLLTKQVAVPRETGFFPTPAPVVHRILELARLTPGSEVLEPSAGQGNIAFPAAEIAPVDCIELLASNVGHLAAMRLYRRVVQADFLEVPAMPIYSHVLMNPPFGKQAESRHVDHALGFLKPGGRLVAVLPSGILFREHNPTRALRERLQDMGATFERLPPASFKPSGTEIDTCLVAATVP